MSETARAVPAGAGGLGGLSSLRMPDRSSLQALSKRSDLFFATAVMGILVVLIFPLPAFLLDLLLAVSIIISVLIMMTGLFIDNPLEFTVFPTLLLVATLLRLALPEPALSNPVRDAVPA